MAQQPSSSLSSRPLSNRSQACGNCRIRKIICDFRRPQCGPCSRSKDFQDCEYAQSGRTRVELLQEQVALAASRIAELEKPSRSQLTLYDPYPGHGRSISQPVISRDGPSSRLPHSGPSPLRPSNSPDISMAELHDLVDNFLNHGLQFGLFLHVQTFRDAAVVRRGPRPPAVLLDAVHLWAIHLSGSSRFTALEARYLSQALRAATEAFAGPHAVLYRVQAAILLAQYFFHNLRFLEGKYHLSAAVSLVLSAGLHRSTAVGRQQVPMVRVPPPLNATEEPERIRAFWTVLTMNNCWTTADGSPSNITYWAADTLIDVPWPVDIDMPGGIIIQQPPQASTGTVIAFLEGRTDNGTSMAALHAKAAILFERAAHLSAQYRPNMPRQQLNEFMRSFTTIDVLIEEFGRSLPAVGSSSTMTRTSLVTRCLVRVATIQLHNPFMYDTRTTAAARILAAARAVVADLALAPVHEWELIDPIMGTLLMATCQVFVAALAHSVRHRRPGDPVPQEERALRADAETVLAVMTVFAPRCPLIESQRNSMRNTYYSV